MPIEESMLQEIYDKVETLRKHEDYYQQVHGVKFIVQGLDYHFNNYMNLCREKENCNWFHEVVAYLNRIGQIYYFFKSDFIKATDFDIPVLKKVLPFRMKHSAHRSLDAPRKEDRPIMMDISIPNIHYVKQSKHDPNVMSRAIALPKLDSSGVRVPFALYIDDVHEDIISEINFILSKKITALGI